jgi:His-Xaa-Ser system protein HxsD
MSAELPTEVLSLDLDGGVARLELDDTLYPLDALYGAAYIFIDRCYVLLDRPRAGRYRAILSPKSGPAEAETLRALAGEFANELLSCAWRHQITQQNRTLIEQVTVRAIGGAMGPPTLDELAKFDFSGEQLEDPLGIAVSWEEKHGRVDKKKGQDGAK